MPRIAEHKVKLETTETVGHERECPGGECPTECR